MDDTTVTDDKVLKIVADYNSSWNYTEGAWHSEWQDMDKLYNGERIYVGYNGISDTTVPLAYSTVQALVAATSGDKPVVEYVPTSPDQETNTKVLNGLFSFYWDIGQWDLMATQSNKNLFKSGTTVSYFYWDIDHPVWQIIPLRDFFCDPSATILTYQKARFMGHRFLASKSAMEDEMMVNPDYDEKDKKSQSLVKKYKNLDKLNMNYETGDQTDKQLKDTMMGTTLDKTAQSDQIEVICYQTHDEMIYVGNREQIIYEGKNSFKERQEFLGIENPTGMYSYTIDSFDADESQLYGRSILKPVAKQIESLNDSTNQNIDAVSWALDPIMELAPEYSSYIDKIKSVTGAVLPFKPGSFAAVQKPIIPSNMFNERTNTKNEIRETTAVDEIAKGISATGDTTATEIKAQTINSGRRFDLIVSQLEAGGYYRMAKLVFQMIQMYVTVPTMFRVVGKDGVSWEEFDPKIFTGDYEPRVKLKSTVEDEKNAKMRNLKEMYTAFLGSPIIKQVPLTRLILGKAFDLNPEEVSELVSSEKEMAQQAQNAQPPSKEKPPEMIALEGIAKSYGTPLAKPDIDAELESLAGLQPSPIHEDAMTTALTQHMTDQNQNIAAGHQALSGNPEDMLPVEGQTDPEAPVSGVANG